jgi:hypothetical protein
MDAASARAACKSCVENFGPIIYAAGSNLVTAFGVTTEIIKMVSILCVILYLCAAMCVRQRH